MRKRWGWYITLLKGKSFKVKILYFEKEKSISHQRHKNRNEVWLFVFGGGELTVSNEKKRIYLHAKNGDSFLIKKDEWHHFIAKEPTLVIEIQYGGKCSERDIERK